MRVRYSTTSWREVTRPSVIAFCSSGIPTSTTPNGWKVVIGRAHPVAATTASATTMLSLTVTVSLLRVRREATTKIDASGARTLALTRVIARTLALGVLALLIGLDGVPMPGLVRAADSPLAEEALERLQISADQRRRLL